MKYVRYGSSPRGAQALVIGGKIRALLHNRVHVSCEDIRAVANGALRHRILLNFEGEAERDEHDGADGHRRSEACQSFHQGPEAERDDDGLDPLVVADRGE